MKIRKIDELLAKLSKTCGLEERSEELLGNAVEASNLLDLQTSDIEPLNQY